MKSHLVLLMMGVLIAAYVLPAAPFDDVNTTDDRTEATFGPEPGPHTPGLMTRATKPTSTGPYTVSKTDASIPRPSMSNMMARIFYPATASGWDKPGDPSGGPYPTLTWAPGAGGHYDDYDGLAAYIASWGIVMAICDFPTGSLSQVNIVSHTYTLDYLEAENASATSVLEGIVDESNFGATGHSNGGWAALRGTAADDRFMAVCTLAAAGHGDGSDVNGVNVPLQLIVGDGDSTFKPVSVNNYASADPIKSLVVVNGAGHSGPFHIEYLISFFKFWLDGDDEYYTFFYGDEIHKDESDAVIQFDMDLGITALAGVSSPTVEEDEQFTFEGEGVISHPVVPGRKVARYEWDFDDDGEFEWGPVTTGSVPYMSCEGRTIKAAVRVTDSWGLRAVSGQVQVTVTNRVPTADAGADVGAFEDETILLNAGGSSDTSSDLANLTYTWDFGNVEFSGWSGEPTVNHTYTEAGKYVVTVTVRDDDGETDEDSLTVTVSNVEPSCEAAADLTDAREDQMINFTGTADDSPSDLDYVKYMWDFGDGATSEMSYSPDAAHNYIGEGTYTATLTVEDDDGARGQSTVAVTVSNVGPTCTAKVEDPTVNEDAAVRFGATSVDSPSDVASLRYRWDFGDMTPGVWNDSADDIHVYEDEGTYTATLTVEDDDGDTGQDTVTITVENVPPEVEADADGTRVDEDETVTFGVDDFWDTPSDIDDLEFSWDFDDGIGGGTGSSVTHQFTDSGKYTVTLTAADDDGDTGTDTVTITVRNVAPEADIAVDMTKAQTGETVVFDAGKSSDTPSDLAFLTYSWDFGDGKSDEGEVVEHSYALADRYTVTLTVSDSELTSSSTVKITVSAPGDGTQEDGDDGTGGGDGGDTRDVAAGGEEDDWIYIAVAVILVLAVVVVIAGVLFLRRMDRKMAGDARAAATRPHGGAVAGAGGGTVPGGVSGESPAGAVAPGPPGDMGSQGVMGPPGGVGVSAPGAPAQPTVRGTEAPGGGAATTTPAPNAGGAGTATPTLAGGGGTVGEDRMLMP